MAYLTELIAGTVVKNGVIHESQVRHNVSRVVRCRQENT